MEKFKFLAKERVSQLSKNSGVYIFKTGREILYIGKATNIKERVKNHFLQATYKDGLFTDQVSKVGYIKTDSEIEALILEANLIKKYQPKFNVVWRDDKNYFYVGITKEDCPQVFITHQPTFSRKNHNNPKTIRTTNNLKSEFIGPFVDGSSLKKTLRILRKIFPYYTIKKHPKTLCPWCHLSLCPGPNPSKKECQKNIKNLISVLKGKRKSVLINLKGEMKKASALQDFEKAAKIRDKIKALEKVISHTKIFKSEQPFQKNNWSETQKKLQKILKTRKEISRIEAYDISNIQGKMATGSMITFINGKSDKSHYRKFKIKISDKPNDVLMIKEVLSRRLQHQEWLYPNLILIDGGRAQFNTAQSIINNQKLTIPVIALAKKKNELFIESQKEPILLKKLPREIFNLILQLRDEAHRFAISYHKNLRRRTLIPHPTRN